jgi:DNA-binding transcriptional regulator YiaG
MSKNWRTLQSSKLSPEAQERARARAKLDLQQLTLKALRRDLELTQVEVSRAASMTQSELSRLENRTDHLTSTLRRYVEALGGQLEIAAVFGGRRVKITDA